MKILASFLMIALTLGAFSTALGNLDIAFTAPAVAEQKPACLQLKAVESIDVPEPKGALNKFDLIKRIHVYKDDQEQDVLYLMAEMCLFGGEGPTPHVVGVFWGYRYEKDEDFLTLEDLDGDGWPELMLKHRAGADEYCLRVFRISQVGNRTDRDSCISASRMVKLIGTFMSGIGSAVVKNGVVVVSHHDEGVREPKAIKCYTLKKGEDKLTEIKS